MSDLVTLAAVLLVFTGAMTGVAWLGVRARRRGTGTAALGAAMNVVDEMWHPASHESHIETRIDAERKKPAPTPDDDDEPRRLAR